jgi:hypothetical protein
MRLTTLSRRRAAILVALLLPMLVLLHGLAPAGAQFPPPKPPFGPNGPGGFNPPQGSKPPFGPNAPSGPNKPGGSKIVYDWRCSNCRAIVATTTSPFRPGVASCPQCGVRFVNGGKSMLTPPPNLPGPGPAPPAGPMAPNPGGPPAGGPPMGAPPPADSARPPNAPPVGGQGAPPPAAPAMPPNAPPAGPPLAPFPADDAPRGGAPADAAPVAPQDLVAPARCSFCDGEVAPRTHYCSRCQLLAIGVGLGATLVFGTTVAIALAAAVWFGLCGRSF